MHAACRDLHHQWDFPGGSTVKNPPATQETGAQSLGREDPLEEEMATHSSILACLGNPTDKKPWQGYSPWGLKRVRQDSATKPQHQS